MLPALITGSSLLNYCELHAACTVTEYAATYWISSCIFYLSSTRIYLNILLVNNLMAAGRLLRLERDGICDQLDATLIQFLVVHPYTIVGFIHVSNSRVSLS